MKCRHCQTELNLTFIDLGTSPPSNSYITNITIHKPEKYFPLRVFVCETCWLVQTEDYAGAEELFDEDYAYFSSYSKTWLKHAENYIADMVARYKLTSSSYIVEVAANDGYLLQFVKARGIPCLGIEPTKSTAHSAREKGIEIIENFFGFSLAEDLAASGKQADLTVANNVLAHVPCINDFVKGFCALLKPNGVSTFEFPHLLNLVKQNQFDTIYHEHYSYLSLTAVNNIFQANGLTIFNVDELATHGGSLRVYAQRSDYGIHEITSNVKTILERELSEGVLSSEFYNGFQKKANQIKNEFLSFLIEAQKAGKIVAGYGAAAKGNTLLNYAGIKTDLLSYVVDLNPVKQNKYLPGCRIPIVDEGHLRRFTPDYVVIFPWNLCDEVMTQLNYIREWGGKFVIAVPKLRVI